MFSQPLNIVPKSYLFYIFQKLISIFEKNTFLI